VPQGFTLGTFTPSQPQAGGGLALADTLATRLNITIGSATDKNATVIYDTASGAAKGQIFNGALQVAGEPANTKPLVVSWWNGPVGGPAAPRAGATALTLAGGNTYAGGTAVLGGALTLSGGTLATGGTSTSAGSATTTTDISEGELRRLANADPVYRSLVERKMVIDMYLNQVQRTTVDPRAKVAQRFVEDAEKVNKELEERLEVFRGLATGTELADRRLAADIGDLTPSSLNYKSAAGSNWALGETFVSDSLTRDAQKAEEGGKSEKSKKPVETWKPSRVVPNSSRLMVGDNEELPLRGMQVDVRIDGFRARVVLDLLYFNDRPRQLEGSFQLRLPQEASPYFFAFGRTVYQAPQIDQDAVFFKREQVAKADATPAEILALRQGSWDEPKVARMVAREKAAFAYRETVRRRVDPALVEWAGAGVFQCRVFPLTPNSLHRVVVGYDVDLVRAGDDLELRLDLPETTPAAVVDFNIAAAAEKEVSLDAKATPSPPSAPSPPAPLPPGERGGRLAYRLVNPTERPILVRLRQPGPVMLANVSGTGHRRAALVGVPPPASGYPNGTRSVPDTNTSGYFATRVTLPLTEALTPGYPLAGASPEKGEGSPRAVFLVDTSLSSVPQFALWTKLLRAVLENNRDRIHEFAVLFFNIETFWWQERFVANTPENVEALLAYADSLVLEGATDLGRALAEAASPSWLDKRSDAGPHLLFLLSDGAATWGEDRWPLLAAAVKGLPSAFGRGTRERVPGGEGSRGRQPPGEEDYSVSNSPSPRPSPGGRGGPAADSPAPRPSPGGRGGHVLFAYQTGMAGDGRLLAYLAEQTGGAVFSVVGESQVATASTAQRALPWRLTGVAMPGGHDILVAGRPQFVFPHQELLVVGRCEPDLAGRELLFTLQQGQASRQVRVKIDRVLRSELAERTYGQVAVGQLEDLAEAAENVATAYARHFRVTGRTCSLLMLESEQDYARFQIKPEEDEFVVKDRPASAVVAGVLEEGGRVLSDPKAAFLAWFRKLKHAPGVHFDLPASLDIALDALPPASFVVPGEPLGCKLRRRAELPEVAGDLAAGRPDYDRTAAKAQRRLAHFGPDDALRALSSLVEDQPGDAALARDVAFSAMAWGRGGHAYQLLRRAAAARPFEPQAYYTMAHCLELAGRADLAIIYYELAYGCRWAGQGQQIDLGEVIGPDYRRFLGRVAEGRVKSTLANYAKARLATLGPADAFVKGDSPIFATTPGVVPAKIGTVPGADLVAIILWNTDGTDVDLHVTDPGGEECYYGHPQNRGGGHISHDITTGFGPEMFVQSRAMPGTYYLRAHYFASDANRASNRTKVFALVYQGWGTEAEKVACKALSLGTRSEMHDLGRVTILDQPGGR
jgi:hypothetical protein